MSPVLLTTNMVSSTSRGCGHLASGTNYGGNLFTDDFADSVCMTRAANSETDYAAESPCSKVKYYSSALSNVVCVPEFPDFETETFETGLCLSEAGIVSETLVCAANLVFPETETLTGASPKIKDKS